MTQNRRRVENIVPSVMVEKLFGIPRPDQETFYKNKVDGKFKNIESLVILLSTEFSKRGYNKAIRE